MAYIDKDAVVAEIEKKKEEEVNYDEDSKSFASYADQIYYSVLDSIQDFLDTIEVKEVDLDREIRRYRMGNPIIQHREETLYDYMANVAKHFFELGLKTKRE